MKTHRIWRAAIYISGIFILALGAVLSTKTGMGVSPITSVSYAVANAFAINFAVSIFLFYSVLVFCQFLIRGKNRRWSDLLQLPFSVFFSVLLDLFDKVLQLQFDQWWQNLMLLMLAIVFTGVGVSMTVNMQLVPNPADGMAHTIGWAIKKEMGLAKNLLDFGCVTIAFLIDLLFGQIFDSVGIGTVVAMLLIGRTVSVFNHFCRDKMLSASGLQRA